MLLSGHNGLNLLSIWVQSVSGISVDLSSWVDGHTVSR